jgi:hypothetical protein
MKHLFLIASLSIMTCLAMLSNSCSSEDDDPKAENDSTDNTTGAQCESELATNTVKFGDATVTIATVELSQNTFGKPRFIFLGKNADESISASFELRGTFPNSGDKYPIDPEFGDDSAVINLYYNKKNWTCTLDATNFLTFTSSGDKHTLCGSAIKVANDKDENDTMLISVNITGDFKF